MRFIALADFISKETMSQYAKGLGYSVRDPKSPLAKLVPQWVEEGKIKIVSKDDPAANLSGKGTT